MRTFRASGEAQVRPPEAPVRHGLLRGSRDLRLTQEVLGHESAETTQVYTQVSPLEAAAVIARL